MNCNYLTLNIPALFTGSLAVNTGLSPDTFITASFYNNHVYIHFNNTINDDGMFIIDDLTKLTKHLNYFSDCLLTFSDTLGDAVKIGGYDGFRLTPYRNLEDVTHVTINASQNVITS